MSAPGIKIRWLTINDGVIGDLKCSASVLVLITLPKHIFLSFTRMSEWTCFRDKRRQWLNSCLQPQRTSALKRITQGKVSAFTFQSMTPWVSLLAVVFSSEPSVKRYEVWMVDERECQRGIVQRQISTWWTVIYYNDIPTDQKQWVADCLINCKLTLQYGLNYDSLLSLNFPWK